MKIMKTILSFITAIVLVFMIYCTVVWVVDKFFNKEVPIEDTVKSETYGADDEGIPPDTSWKIIVKNMESELQSTKKRVRYLQYQLNNMVPDTVKEIIEFVSFDVPETLAEDTLVWSSKLFNYEPYIKSTVMALASSKVIKFKNPVYVDWENYRDDKIMPLVQDEFKIQRRKGRYEGLVAGIAATALTVYLVK